MPFSYRIHPSIGVARVGNADDFYLAPTEIGGLPLECDGSGNEAILNGVPRSVQHFKTGGKVRRQGARFSIYRYDDEHPLESPIDVTGDLDAVRWTAHLANKKAAWWNYKPLVGDLMFGEDNSYDSLAKTGEASLRNATITDLVDRRSKLIVDPGPRTLTGSRERVEFSRTTIPAGYPGGFPPPNVSQGFSIDTLGDMLTDDVGRLIIVGGFGRAGGEGTLSSFAGGDAWYDDIADGPITCDIQVGSESHTLTAWCIVGCPKFAPQLVNMTTLDDIMLDVAVQYLNLAPEIFDSKRWPESKGWNTDFCVNFERDILPVMRRAADNIWVANTQSMVAFAYPRFDARDHTESNRASRLEYFSYFRAPSQPTADWTVMVAENHLWINDMPMMPVNSGDNSVTNYLVRRFLSLTPTQYFFLQQWANGKFKAGPCNELVPIHALDRASVGNCVGAPMCPGIEVTWNTRNPSIYETPWRILQAHDETYYATRGLSPDRDEARGGGCEPGDLTKRMAIPWQADFFDCGPQFISFNDPTPPSAGSPRGSADNQIDHLPIAPTYYAYWWPPQSPVYVLSGDTTALDQSQSGVSAGAQVFYPRGINSIGDMILGWRYLGFVVNKNTSAARQTYPYFVEVERNHDQFISSAVAIGAISNVISATDQTFFAQYFLRDQTSQATVALDGATNQPKPIRTQLGFRRTLAIRF